MSFYRFKIRNNNVFFSGGTNSINPMVNSGQTGNQQFSEYLTIYDNKPGQNNTNISSNDLIKRKDIVTRLNKNDFNTGNVPTGFNELKEQLRKNPFETTKIDKKSSIISSGTTIFKTSGVKYLSIPINNTSLIVDYSDDIDAFVEKETKKRINTIVDNEKVKFFSNPYPSIKIKFRFYDKSTSQFDDTNLSGGYSLAEFNSTEINKKNNFKKSFFRLYFFDTDDIKTQNLLLTEEIDVFRSTKPEFNLSRIFWLKNDDIFMNNNNNRTVYMEARFFNAKTGRVNRFINTPITINTPININTLKNNPDWKFSKLLIVNPKNNNGKREFKTVNGVGANTQNTITLTEYILET